MTILDDFETPEVADLGNGRIAEPTGQYDRYILPRGDGQSMEYTRTTTLVGDADGSYGVMTWRKYRAAWGVAQRDDLIAQLRAVPADDKATIREVCNKAEQIAGTDEGTNFGIAAHAILQRVDEGLPIEEAHEYWRPLIANYLEALRVAGIKVLPQYVERTCRYARYDVAGKPDNIYQLHDGSLAIGDKKTTADIERAEKAIASQLAIYANCEHMMDYTTGRFEPMPPVRKDFALIILISTENFTVTVERIDIQYGLARTRLMVELRESNKAKGLRHPYIAPGHWDPVPKTVLPEAAGNGRSHYDPTAYSAQVAAKVAAEQAGPVAPEQPSTAQVATRPTPQPAATVGPTPAPVAPPRIEAPAVDPDARVIEIMAVRKNDKPALQQWAKALGCTDLAHHRKWLAEWIVAATPGSGAVEQEDKINLSANYGGESGLPPAPSEPPGQSVVGSGTPHRITAGIDAAPAVTNDLTPDAVIPRLRGAVNLQAIQAVWQAWTTAYGPGSWETSGAVKEAADQRANFLRAQTAGDDGPPF